MLAALMVSTLGFSVSRHYCMGNLVDEQLFAFANDCCEEKDDHCGCDENHQDDDCCDDETLIIEGLQIQSFQPKELAVDFSKSLELNPIVQVNTILAPTTYSLLPTHYFSSSPPSPPSGRDILVCHQRFLI